MSTQNSDPWRTRSPYLEEALSMTEEQRFAWISATRTCNPRLAAHLEKFLHEAQPSESKDIPKPTPLAGQTLGVYTLLSQTGVGGMSTVWLAERNDGRFERKVAVKFLNI